ncbi:MAG TPA: FtsQ-type POTRA domain-containing protein [Thermoanaerobaculia bacterium]|jgi:cell division septal protein FtsQ
MSTFDQSEPRFFRPSDATRIRRNLRVIQLQRAGVLLRNAIFMAVVVIGAFWAYRQTQSDARFAVRHIEIAGAVHTQRAAIESITHRYLGLNLFKIDIARVQSDLHSLPWIQRIAIEKKVPDTLRINVVERVPVALAMRDGTLQYVDATGAVCGELSPAVGDSDLPVVRDAEGSELVRSVQFIDDLRAKDPVVYSRIGEVRPIAPRGFAIFDRDLDATVYANADDVSSKFRDLYAIAQSEKLGRSQIQYADLRFSGRIVIKPVHPITTAAAPLPISAPAQITN